MRIQIKKQQGAVLFISLIILILLTLLGLSSLRSTQTQEKMSGNYKELNRSFEAAETALRSGESWLQNYIINNGGPPPISVSANPTTGEVWELNGPTATAGIPNWWTQRDALWWTQNNHSVQYISGKDIDGDGNNEQELEGFTDDKINNNPRFIIEEHSFIPYSLTFGSKEGKYYYRITAKGTGNKVTKTVSKKAVDCDPSSLEAGCRYTSRVLLQSTYTAD